MQEKEKKKKKVALSRILPDFQRCAKTKTAQTIPQNRNRMNIANLIL